MENLEVKQIDFLGNTLMAAQDADGTIWAGVRWLCDEVGLTKGQRDRQMINIQANRVLMQGASNLRLPTNGGVQDVFCLKLDFVPMWLAKINITPTMESETPDVADKLEAYQLKAKDVLAAAFLPEQRRASTAEIVSLMAQNNVEFERKLLALESQATALTAQNAAVQTQLDTLTRNNPAYWRSDMDAKIAALAASLRVPEGIVRSKLYKNLEYSAEVTLNNHIDLTNRLTRMRNQARGRGVSYNDRMKITKLDVIGKNEKLRARFEVILNEAVRKCEQRPMQLELSGARR